MKRLLLVIVLVSVVPCVGFGQAQSQQGWPRKGDKIFIAATFEGMVHMFIGEHKLPDGALDACSELVIKDANPDKPRWTAASNLSPERLRLEGPWLPRMHKTEKDCKAQVSAEGEATVKRSGSTFTILPANPK